MPAMASKLTLRSGPDTTMTIPSSEYGDKEINELGGESVLIHTKAANEMEITDVEKMSLYVSFCAMPVRYLKTFGKVHWRDIKGLQGSIKL